MCGLSRAKEEERALGKSPLWWAETGEEVCVVDSYEMMRVMATT